MASVLPENNRTAWITAQRPARTGGQDPFKPHGFFLEEECDHFGRIARSAVVLLTNKECPWRCLMCDLWQNTLPETVPPGAIPRQIDYALAQLAGATAGGEAEFSGDQTALPLPRGGGEGWGEGATADPPAPTNSESPLALTLSPSAGERETNADACRSSHSSLSSANLDQIKLYNSGSFFDPAAIPLADYAAIAERVAFARRVVVESHPRLVGDRTLRLRDLLAGSLEVAMGLETAHPEILSRLNKKFTLAHFAEAAKLLRQAGVAVRAFVLVKPPFMSEAEGLEWAVKSAAFAFDCGAEVVSLIPTRPGNGAMDRLVAAGEFSPPHLATLESALELAIALRRGRVFADTWNLEPFATCAACFPARRQRLHEINLSQQNRPRVECAVCGKT